ncbi:metallophosphoesterase [Levilactobacillus angrenensis]|uniref:Metallophosphoesterase n=1 Tax=Levilactobacillus angrenensis TaxID=2486020 RepID=A0ABW1UBH3_9LACO|nr:metallophosphoesterase [Levilactobacillus angrenensis]
MVRVALISDLHLDVNQQDAATVARQQAAYLTRQRVGVYLIAGDITNYFDQSLAFVTQLQKLLAPTPVRFIAGNHDMLHDITYAGLESPLAPVYLHRGYLDVKGTNWRVIGNNGWYDYRFADNLVNRDFAVWKRAYWVDSTITQPMSDPERLAVSLAQLTAQLTAAQAAHKRVLVMTHFVPRRDYIRYTDDDRFWNMANALMGSPQTGALMEKYSVPVVLFGHSHQRFAPKTFGTTTYLNQALGYHNRRINEWSQPDYFTEWQRRLKILDLK